MSWHYLQEQEGKFSVVNYLAGIRSERSKSKNTPEKSSDSDNETVSCLSSRYGMILKRLMVDLGKGVLISFPGGSLVKTFQQQEKAKGLQGNGQDSGKNSKGSLTKYDPVSASWKTAQCSLLGDLESFSETWPKWGTMLDGACWELMTPEPLIDEKESGFWLTPNCMDSLDARSEEALKRQYDNNRQGRTEHSTLREQVVYPKPKEMWPTPTKVMYKGTSPNSMHRKDGKSRENDRLDYAVAFHGGTQTRQTYPTPSATARGAHTGKESGEINKENKSRTSAKGVKYGATLETVIGSGQLNPDWVEWLMGWPLGWTDLKPLEMDRFQEWKQSHLLFSVRA